MTQSQFKSWLEGEVSQTMEYFHIGPSEQAATFETRVEIGPQFKLKVNILN